MKTIYSSAFLCFFLVGFSARGQMTAPTIPNPGSAAPITVSAAAGVPLGVLTNGVLPPTLTWLPDEPSEAIETGLAAAPPFSVEEESTNGLPVVRFVYQSSSATIAAATQLARGAAQSGNSPQPLDSVGGCIRPGSGLIAWWEAENDANDRVGAHNGQLLNGASFAAGKVGQAFNLNPQTGQIQSVQVPYGAGLMTTGLTIELWINPTRQISAQAFVFGQAYGRQMVLTPGSGGVNVSFYLTDTSMNFYGVTSSPIPISQWTHLAATYDGATIKLYTNAVLCRSSSFSLALGNSGCPWNIGGLNSACGASGQGLPAEVDEVSLYNRALLAGEINAIYLAGAAGKCTTSQPCTCTPTNAVASWPGEGDASDMFNIYPGTLQNGVSFGQGMVASAVSLNPTNQQAVEMSPLSSLLTSPFSFDAWIKPLSQLGGSPHQAFIMGQSYGSQLVVTNGLLGLRVGFALAVDRTTFHELVSSGDIPLGEWTHVAAVYDGTTMSLYVNGALDQQAAVNFTPFDSGCPFHLGGVYDPSGDCTYTGQYFNGLIDEATVYSQPLTASDVQALYNAGEAGKCYSLGYWLKYYFGPDCWNETYATATADADGDGNVNFQEYLNHTDPNKITFSISVTNQYVTTTSVPVQVNVVTGVPSYYGLLVNDSNPSHAGWLPFTTGMVWVPTPTNGSYVITVGLCGLAPTATQTWQTVTVFRETAPLTLTLTNLATFSGPRPIIDVGGNAGRALSSLTWTLVNANGSTNTGNGAVVAQGWSLSDPFHTTTWFQCLDLALAPGANAISLQAADWAGNLAVTNFTYIFDTNAAPAAPVLKLIWPQNQARVSPDAFTLQAWTDDDTASLALQYTDANGMVQTVNASAERGGNVWVQGVSLSAGTNILSLMATNAAGRGTATNFTVVQGGVGLTVYPLSPSTLPYGYVTVIASVGTPASSVTVNGTHGTSSDGLTWQVDNVPLAPGGTVALQATAQLTGGTTLQTLLTQQRDPIVFTQRYGYTLDYSMLDWTAEETNASTTVHIDFEWQRGAGGTATETISTVYFNDNPSETTVKVTTWPPDNGYFPTLSGQQVINQYEGDQLIGSSTNPADPPAVEWFEDSKSAGTWPENFDVGWTESSSREVRLFTGGDAKRQNQGLFDLSAPLNFETWLSADVPDWGFVFQAGGFLSPTDPPTPVPSQQIILGGLGRLGDDGQLWKVEPDGCELTITPKALSAASAFPGVSFMALAPGSQAVSTAGALPAAPKFKLRIDANGNPIGAHHLPPWANYCVGQNLTFSQRFTLALPVQPQIWPILWHLTGYYVNDGTNVVRGGTFPNSSTNFFVNQYLLTNQTTSAWWISGGFNPPEVDWATLVEGLTFPNGQYVVVDARGKFNMFQPQVANYPPPTGVAIVANLTDPLSLWLGLPIMWDLYVNLNTNFPGSLFYAQLINVATSWDVRPSGSTNNLNSAGQFWLDGGFPYTAQGTSGPFTKVAPQIDMTYNDYPKLVGPSPYSFASASYRFKTYPCFQPNSGGSIPVALGQYYWGWDGTLAYSGATISLTVSNVVPPAFTPQNTPLPIWTNTWQGN